MLTCQEVVKVLPTFCEAFNVLENRYNDLRNRYNDSYNMLTCQEVVKALPTFCEAFNVLINCITIQRIVITIPYYYFYYFTL
jgi:hypothetical protein